MEIEEFTPYVTFSREAWKALRMATPLLLSEKDLDRIHGINEQISLNEISDIYLPLSRLLNLYAASTQRLYEVTQTFLGKLPEKVPYIIGIAGSVAVGKSTTARLLQALLANWPNQPKVDLITTDSFLHSNQWLEEHGLMNRKGFPESYDIKTLMDFLSDIKSGRETVTAPVYSHLDYDIIPGEIQIIEKPEILIVEGLNVLQSIGEYKVQPQSMAISDFFDFSIYVDAEEEDIIEWYRERFHILQQTAFQAPEAYFHRFAQLSGWEIDQLASDIWWQVNGVNLRQHIRPTMRRARLILKKGKDHLVEQVMLRKL